MTILLIDDEHHVLTGLRDQLESLFPGEFIIYDADGVKAGLQKLREVRPDIVFLDVQMTDGTGFDFLEQVSGRSFEVIFLTAYQEYAVEAFQEQAAHYLLKPVSPVKLKKALLHALDILERKSVHRYVRAQRIGTGSVTERFQFPTMEGVQFLPFNEIAYVEAKGNYLELVRSAPKQQPILVSKPLRFFEAQMDPTIFVRVHRSYIVNATHIELYLKSNGGFVRMSTGDEVPVSQKYKHEFLQRIGYRFS